jgi:hypothetical protein
MARLLAHRMSAAQRSMDSQHHHDTRAAHALVGSQQAQSMDASRRRKDLIRRSRHPARRETAGAGGARRMI